MGSRNLQGLFGRAGVLAGAGALSISMAHTPLASAAPLYTYQQSIAVPGVATFTGYDTSVFDQSTQLFYLTDRSNNAIDIFSGASNTFVGQIGKGLYSGTQGGNNDISGPNGVSIANFGAGKVLATSDGTSSVIAYNLDSSGRTVVGTPRVTSTAVAGTPTPPNRVDSVVFSPVTNTILAANNASDPGFVTLINNANGAVIRSIPLDGTNGYPNVGGNGVEATLYSASRGSFFVAVPAFDPSSTPTDAGGVIELNATTGALLNTYNFNALSLAGTCSPTGLAEGAGGSLFVACSASDARGSVILNPAGSGSVTLVPGINGGDEAAYDPVSNIFIEESRFPANNIPVLGIVDASTLALQLIKIGANDHSVAIDFANGEIFVPSGPTTAIPGCTAGCIGVFGVSVPEPATLPVLAMALTGFVLLRRRQRG